MRHNHVPATYARFWNFFWIAPGLRFLCLGLSGNPKLAAEECLDHNQKENDYRATAGLTRQCHAHGRKQPGWGCHAH